MNTLQELDLPRARGTYEGFAATVVQMPRKGRAKPTYAGEVATDGGLILHVEGKPGKWTATGWRSSLMAVALPTGAKRGGQAKATPSEGAERALEDAVGALRRSIDGPPES